MALNLADIVEHGRRELADAEAVLLLHQEDRFGLCLCQRVWPCDARTRWAGYANYWWCRLNVLEVQVALLAKTTPLPVLAK
jgi:hypothetical protein